jgi:hypothetical protein
MGIHANGCQYNDVPMQVQDLPKSRRHLPADALRRESLMGMLRGAWNSVRFVLYEWTAGV